MNLDELGLFDTLQITSPQTRDLNLVLMFLMDSLATELAEMRHDQQKIG